MFPRPIQDQSLARQRLYKIALPISLIVWLLPMIAIVATAGRSLSDINYGNYWGVPTKWAFVDNFTAVFDSSPILIYLMNSFIITVPAIIGALFLSTLAGAGLALYKFKFRFFIFALFIAGNFVPFQILMMPVRQLTLDLGIFCSRSHFKRGSAHSLCATLSQSYRLNWLNRPVPKGSVNGKF
jgi:multiple sugar transport system permease protein